MCNNDITTTKLTCILRMRIFLNNDKLYLGIQSNFTEEDPPEFKKYFRKVGYCERTYRKVGIWDSALEESLSRFSSLSVHASQASVVIDVHNHL